MCDVTFARSRVDHDAQKSLTTLRFAASDSLSSAASARLAGNDAPKIAVADHACNSSLRPMSKPFIVLPLVPISLPQSGGREPRKTRDCYSVSGPVEVASEALRSGDRHLASHDCIVGN